MGKKKDKKGRKSKNNQLSAEKQFQTEIKNIIEKIILKTEEDDPDCPIRIKTGKSKNKFSYSDLQVFINEQTKDVNVHNLENTYEKLADAEPIHDNYAENENNEITDIESTHCDDRENEYVEFVFSVQ